MDSGCIVSRQVEIGATPELVWKALTNGETIDQWMPGSRVESRWKPGSEIRFAIKMPGFEDSLQDRGTVLESKAARLLQYSHWSQASGLPDLPENRSLVSLEMERRGEATLLTVFHEHFPTEAACRHADFFWRCALHDMKRAVESLLV